MSSFNLFSNAKAGHSVAILISQSLECQKKRFGDGNYVTPHFVQFRRSIKKFRIASKSGIPQVKASFDSFTTG